jgi:hypothetical protein
MLNLVCPQPRTLPNFNSCRNQRAAGFFLLLLLGLITITTGCASLNAGGSGSTSTNAVQPIAISAHLPAAIVGTPYSAVLAVSGGTAPYIFAIRGGGLPPGLTMNSASGSISGQPKLSGFYAFMISVSDNSRTAQGLQRLAITVNRPSTTVQSVQVAISPASFTLAPGASHQFVAEVSNASNPDVTWSASAGTITATGLFTAANVNAPAIVQLIATSQADPDKRAIASVIVSAPPTPTSLTIAAASLPEATEGTPYSAALHVSGGTAPYHWKIASGSLPAGFAFDATEGTINGITSQSGPFPFTVEAGDASGQSVAHKFTLSVSLANTGNVDGPAELPRVYMKSSLADTPAPGATHQVQSGASLQAALDSAKCGDTIRLQAGATFTGAVVLPAKNCDDDHWIVVRTSAPDSALPPEGTRLSPCYAGVASLPGRPSFACSSPGNVLARIVFSSTGSGPIIMADGANHYRLIGLEITRGALRSTVYNLVINEHGGTSDHIIIDRSWIHGTAQDETTRGIMLTASTYVAVVDSFFSDFHCVAITGSCGDSQAIAGGVGDHTMGPYKIVNNYLEAAGENVILGGGPATRTPEDIEIRRNLFFKPLIWMRGAPGFVGGRDGNSFIVKNLFELKNAQRVLLEGNVLDNSWGGFTQVGFAMLLTPKNPGNCSICMVRDVTVRYSRIAHAGAAMQIGNGLSDYGFAALEGSHYSIHDLVFDDMKYEGCPGCNGDMFQITTTPKAPPTLWLHDVSIRHITVATNRAHAGWAIAGPAGQQNMVFDNSIVDSGVIPNVNAGGGATQCYYGKSVIKGVLDACWSHYTFSNNVLIDARANQTWPAENFAVGSASGVGFVSWNGGKGGDYHLASSSPFKGKATDGKDPGADIDAVDAATAGVY